MKALTRKEITGAVFLDIEAVWHEGLVLKMVRLGINLTIVRLIRSYLNGRTFQVRVDRVFSQTRQITAGVLHGSILRPQLLLVYFSYLPREPGIVLAGYADNTTIFSSFPSEFPFNRIQKSLYCVVI